DDLTQAARRFADAKIDVVAICGGDGTNLWTLTELMRAYGAAELPAVAFLGGGTLNTVAKNLGFVRRPKVQLKRLVAAMRCGTLSFSQQETLTVNGLCGFIFAAAMGARFLEAYYDGPVTGVTWAALLAARTALSALGQGPLARRLFEPVDLALE